MKKSLLLFAAALWALLTPFTLRADGAIEARLRAQYGQAQHQPQGGGWYLLSYYRHGEYLYGFANKQGHVVVDGATQYKIHKGFLELELLDLQQKALHDQWEEDMRQYERDYQEYTRVKKNFEAEMRQYRARVEAAEREAHTRYEYARRQAIARAQAQARAASSRSSSGGLLGAVLSGVASAASTALAANSVKLQPFIDEVMAERELTVPPYEPYNPCPEKPEEPATGYYWKSYTYQQPSPYDEVDFEAIKDEAGFANVKRGNRYGLVDASLKQIFPCNNTEPVSVGTIGACTKVRIAGKLGLINESAKQVVPTRYASIEACGEAYKVGQMKGEKMFYGLLDDKGKELLACQFEVINPTDGYLFCKRDGLWGIYTPTYHELYPCQYQQVEFLAMGDQKLLRNQKEGQWGVVNFSNGKELLPNRYATIDILNLGPGENLIRAERDKKFALYSADGNLLLPCEFSTIRKAKTGQNIYVERDKTIGLYTSEGVAILEPGQYTHYTFDSPFYLVKSHGLMGACGLYGQPLVECRYETLQFNRKLNGFIASKHENGARKWGVVNLVGEELFPFVEGASLEYDNATDPYLTLRSPLGTLGAVDFAGKVVVPTKLKDRSKIAPRAEKYAKKGDLNGPWSLGREGLNEANEFMESSNQSIAFRRRGFDFYARHLVERDINEWQKRGEFEREEDYRLRVNENTRRQRVYGLTKELQRRYALRHMAGLKDNLQIVGNYNAGNQTFRLHSSLTDKEFLLSVPASEAMEFKQEFASIEKLPRLRVEGEGVVIDSYLFRTPSGRTYRYENPNSGQAVAQVEYRFSRGGDETRGGLGGEERLSTRSIAIGCSDVDLDIPTSERTREETYAVIIANENYQNEAKLAYAYNDGQSMYDYLIEGLGVPAEQVHFRSDATLNELRYEVNWLREAAAQKGEKARVIFYYAGHSLADSRTRASHLLPIDGRASSSASAYQLSELYKNLGGLPAEQVLILLDTSLGGARRPVNDPKLNRTPLYPRGETLSGNTVVMAATTGTEQAQAYTEKQHGLFTYYLLKKLQESEGELNFGQLADQVVSNVRRQAPVLGKRAQTPTVTTSSKAYSKWRSMAL